MQTQEEIKMRSKNINEEMALRDYHLTEAEIKNLQHLRNKITITLNVETNNWHDGFISSVINEKDRELNITIYENNKDYTAGISMDTLRKIENTAILYDSKVTSIRSMNDTLQIWIKF